MTNGCGNGCLAPSTVTAPSSIASRNADCVRGGGRFSSSTRTTLANSGPGTKVNALRSGSQTPLPVMSAGSRSAVPCTRRKLPPRLRATARASVVLPVPGTSSPSTWPPASTAQTTSSTCQRRPCTTCSTLSTSAAATAVASARAERSSERAERAGGTALLRQAEPPSCSAPALPSGRAPEPAYAEQDQQQEHAGERQAR